MKENIDYKIENGHLTIFEGVKLIKDWEFAENSLTSVTIPNSVTKIGNMAFAASSKLKSVTIPEKFKKDLERIFSENYKTIEFNFI